MASLDHLPCELLFWIHSYLDTFSLAALCMVSRWIYQSAVDSLYRNPTIRSTFRTNTEDSIFRYPLRLFLETILRCPDLAKKIKSIRSIGVDGPNRYSTESSLLSNSCANLRAFSSCGYAPAENLSWEPQYPPAVLPRLIPHSASLRHISLRASPWLEYRWVYSTASRGIFSLFSRVKSLCLHWSFFMEGETFSSDGYTPRRLPPKLEELTIEIGGGRIFGERLFQGILKWFGSHQERRPPHLQELRMVYYGAKGMLVGPNLDRVRDCLKQEDVKLVTEVRPRRAFTKEIMG